MRSSCPTHLILFYPTEQRCTRFLHACSALCKCANWCVKPASPTLP
jgi:hypothetical protein